MTGLEFISLEEKEIKEYIETLPDKDPEVDYGKHKKLLGLSRVGRRQRGKVIKFPVVAKLIGAAALPGFSASYHYVFLVNNKPVLEIKYVKESGKRAVTGIVKYESE